MAKTKRRQTKRKKDGRAKTSPENGRKGGRPPLPPFTDTGHFIVDDLFHDPKLKHHTLAHWRKSWYKYDGRGWHEFPDGELEKVIVSWLETHSDFGASVRMDYIHNLLAHMASFNLCGISDLKDLPLWIKSGESAKNWISFSNGMSMNVWDAAHGQHHRSVKTSPDLFTHDVVDYPIDTKAKCPLFLKYLSTSLPSPDSRAIVREMLGLCLSDTTKYETFFYLYGPSARNGKTVLLRIMEALVGKANVSNVGLHNLSERFETWPLAEAKINIHGDMRTDVGVGTYTHIEGVFKDFVSGGNLEYQKKGQDKFNAKCRARFVFAGNSLPTFVDRSDAIWERLRVIYFPYQIPKEQRDPNLADKIIANELAGVFNWAMQGLKSVVKAGRIRDSRDGKRMKDEHRFSCDREAVFLKERGYVKGEPEDSVNQPEMYEFYKQWMSRNGYKWLGAERFYTRIEALIPGVKIVNVRKKGPRDSTLHTREFRGLKRESI